MGFFINDFTGDMTRIIILFGVLIRLLPGLMKDFTSRTAMS